MKLEALFECDGEHSGNTVSSIYLDTPDLSHLNDTIDGNEVRQKIRLRTYNDGTYVKRKSVFVEIKNKLNQLGSKKRWQYDLQFEGFKSDLVFLENFYNKQNTEIWEKCHCILHPTIFIQYDRLRYVDEINGTRISLDQNINSRKLVFAPFDENDNAELNVGVLELKNQSKEKLQKTFSLISNDRALIWTSFSKYAVAFHSHSDNFMAYGYGNHIINK